MNIITGPASQGKGGKFGLKLVRVDFLNLLNYNSGLIKDKLALSGTIVRKTGDGFIDGTWTDACFTT